MGHMGKSNESQDVSRIQVVIDKAFESMHESGFSVDETVHTLLARSRQEKLPDLKKLFQLMLFLKVSNLGGELTALGMRALQSMKKDELSNLNGMVSPLRTFNDESELFSTSQSQSMPLAEEELFGLAPTEVASDDYTMDIPNANEFSVFP